MKTTITIPANHLQALQSIVKLAAKDVRFFLASVCFDLKENHAVASNGHVLLAAPITVEGDAPEMSDSLLLNLTGVRIPKKAGVFAMFELDTDTDRDCKEVTLSFSDGTSALVKRERDVQYVDWRLATAKTKTGVDAYPSALSFNPEYIQVVGKSLPKQTAPVFRFLCSGPATDKVTMIKVDWRQDPDLLHVIMPVRI